MTTKKIKIPSVLAFEKKLVPSNGYMYGTTWEQRHENIKPLKLTEETGRGTKAHSGVSDAEITQPNLYSGDKCSLNMDQDTVKVHFTLKILSGIQNPCACNDADFHKAFQECIDKYVEKHSFTELALRYAVNIANGRFLWKNRVAEKVEVNVKVLNGNIDKKWCFDATKFSMRDFNTDDKYVKDLARGIEKALSGKYPFLLLEIESFSEIGKAQQVYPSEEIIHYKGNDKFEKKNDKPEKKNDKPEKKNDKFEKGKVLYNIEGIAGMHSQKIGNALRTIDTWYGEYDECFTGPIAVDPYGAVTDKSIVYRHSKTSTDFYTLFNKYVRNKELETAEQEHFVVANLVRGGVFGGGKG